MYVLCVVKRGKGGLTGGGGLLGEQVEVPEMSVLQ